MGKHNNEEEIRSAIGILFKPGQLVEIRGKSRKGQVSRQYFTNHVEMARFIAKANLMTGWEAIWYTLQGLRPETVDTKVKGQMTRREDIDCYQWLPIDIDRPKGDPNKKANATDAEIACLYKVCEAVQAWLLKQGFPEPIVACSGNGWHLLYKLPPLSPEWYDTLKNVLRAVAHAFREDVDIAEIDTSLAEPEQVIKAYGTTSRKSPTGDDPERPWRESKIVHSPETIEPVSEEILRQVSRLAPVSSSTMVTRQKSGGLHSKFDAEDLLEWGGEYTPVIHTYEKNRLTHYVMGNCCMATEDGFHTHSGDAKKTEFILGRNFGFHCFSDDCEGYTIGDVLRKLHQLKGEPYPGKIWNTADDPEFLDDVADTGIEPEAPPDDETNKSDEVGPESSSEQVVNPPVSLNNDANLVLKLAAAIFRNPNGNYAEFALYRARIAKVAARKAWHRQYLLLLNAILSFESQHRKLPTKAELLDTNKLDVELIGLIDQVEDSTSDLTIDYLSQQLIQKARLLDDRRTADKWAKLLKETKDVDESRAYLKAQLQDGITLCNVRTNNGSVQDHAPDIYERYKKMLAEEPKSSPLTFRTGFPGIDEFINSEQERCFAIIGPPNNFKTSILLSTTYNLAKQGKAVLLVTGEHDVENLEELMALLHGHHCRERFRFSLPALKSFRDRKVSTADLTNLQTVLDDLNTLVSCPGPIVIKHANEFHNDFDEVVQFMESTHGRYDWNALVIDPFDTLLLNTEPCHKFFGGQSLASHMFDLKTSYHGGRGLIVMTSLQMKKSVKAIVEKLQNNPKSGLTDFANALDASSIETYSAAVQKFDMLLAVSARNKLNRQGVIVCARTRFSRPFDPLWFSVDPESHYCFEKPRNTIPNTFIPEEL